MTSRPVSIVIGTNGRAHHAPYKQAGDARYPGHDGSYVAACGTRSHAMHFESSEPVDCKRCIKAQFIYGRSVSRA